jgi:hypothetical protein
MEGKNILLFVIIIVLLIIVIRYIMKDVNTLTGLSSAKTMQTIAATDLAKTSSASSTSNFTYAIWFFIDDWNYRYGESKIIFGRMASGNGDKEPCPSVTLGEITNDITVSLAVFPGLDEIPDKPQNFIIHECSVSNVPIQRWCNILISAYGRTLDLYLDGKLVRTCVLPGVSKIDPNASVYITPMGGFSGWTAKFQYWYDSCDPQKAWNIYKDGYGASLLGSLFGRYTIKLSLMDGDNEESSLAI